VDDGEVRGSRLQKSHRQGAAARRQLRRPVKRLAIPLLWLSASALIAAQAPTAQPPAPATTPRTARAAAPVDFTGYWVSVINKDWRYRMVRPAKGDYASVPVKPEARQAADAWDPAADERAGEQCKPYGAPALLRMPGRLHITWQDDTTLKVEADAGTQTRVLHFGNWKSDGGPATWQGDSVAQWETPRVPAGAERPPATSGDLKVVTTHLRPGYLRRNGLPYSANTVLTEYWDLLKDRQGQQWIVVTTLVDDPTYLNAEWITSLNFKKEPDGSKWEPTPCSLQ
jgi:hypothetical protein